MDFGNDRMESLLLNRDNIPILEHLLDDNSRRLEALRKLREEGKLDFGDRVSSRELGKLFAGVKLDVDDFLETHSTYIDSPRYASLLRPRLETIPYLILSTLFGYWTFRDKAGIDINEILSILIYNQRDWEIPDLLSILLPVLGYGLNSYLSFNSLVDFIEHNTSPNYSRLTKTIRVKKGRRANLIPTLSHEYGHHLVRSRFKGSEFGSIFSEGFAMGVQRNLSRTYSEREDNMAFLYGILDITVGEIKAAYAWICRRLGEPVRKNLLTPKSCYDDSPRNPSDHAKGNTVFSIYETLYTPGFYRDIIHNDFSFN